MVGGLIIYHAPLQHAEIIVLRCGGWANMNRETRYSRAASLRTSNITHRERDRRLRIWWKMRANRCWDVLCVVGRSQNGPPASNWNPKESRERFAFDLRPAWKEHWINSSEGLMNRSVYVCGLLHKQYFVSSYERILPLACLETSFFSNNMLFHFKKIKICLNFGWRKEWNVKFLIAFNASFLIDGTKESEYGRMMKTLLFLRICQRLFIFTIQQIR